MYVKHKRCLHSKLYVLLYAYFYHRTNVLLSNLSKIVIQLQFFHELESYSAKKCQKKKKKAMHGNILATLCQDTIMVVLPYIDCTKLDI